MMAQAVLQPNAATTTEKSPVQIRKLGHVVLWVSDIQRSVNFYTEVLNFKVSDWDKQPSREMVFLNACGDHHTVALFSRPGGEMPPPEFLQLSHFALEIGHIDDLFAIRDYLRAKGIPIKNEGRRRAGCNIQVEIDDPDGYRIEMYSNMDQVGKGDRPRPADQFRPTSTLEEARDNPVPANW